MTDNYKSLMKAKFKKNKLLHLFLYLIIVESISYILYKLDIIEIFGTVIGVKEGTIYGIILIIIDIIFAYILTRKIKLSPFQAYFTIMCSLFLCPFFSAFLGYIIEPEEPFFAAMIFLPLSPLGISKNGLINVLTLLRIPALIGAIMGDVEK